MYDRDNDRLIWSWSLAMESSIVELAETDKKRKNGLDKIAV